MLASRFRDIWFASSALKGIPDLLYLYMEEKVPKLKTKSAAKKRFNFTASGMVIAQPAFKRHGMRKRPQKMKRQARGTMILSPCDAQNVVKYMPYK
jgi:large subunit ribosomal protein L35